MKKILLIPTFLLFVLEIFGQTDTAFWFAPPFVNATNGNGPVFLRLANTTNQATNVRVYAPSNVGGVNFNVTIPANGNRSIDLTPVLNLLTDVIPDKIKNTGLKIESQRNITAYYEVVGRGQSDLSKNMTNPEIFVLKGDNALGNTFFIPSQNFWTTDGNPNSDGVDGKTTPGWYGGQARSTIDIVATQDGTDITITPSSPYRTAAGAVVNSLAPFTKRLNKGQVYTHEAAFWAPNRHLGGTKVTSNKPIAITDKDDSVKEGSLVDGFGYDLLGDQLVPANVVGTEYLVVQGYTTAKTPTGVNDYVFIVPTENGTYINADGLISGPFNAGQLTRVLVSKPAIRVFSASTAGATEADPSKPIYVYHVTGVANELASAILPSTNCSGSTSVTFARTDLPADNLNFYVNIIVKDGGQNSFTVNGVAASGLDFSAPPIGGWRYTRVLNTALFPVGTHTVANTSTVFHLAVFFGGDQLGASYGYFSDFGNFKVDLGLDKFNCADNKVKFQLANYPSIVWTSNTFSGSVNSNPLIADKSGQYIVTITDDNKCRSKDTANVAYAPEVKIEQFDKSRPICKESDDPARTRLAINKEYDRYKWIFPNGDIINDKQIITPTTAGIYKIVVTNLFGTNKELACSAEDTARVVIKSNFFKFKDLGDSITLCSSGASSYPLDLNYAKSAPPTGIDGVTITWFKNKANLNLPNGTWLLNLNALGEFKAVVKDKYECKLRDSVYVNYVDKITVSLGGDTTVACLTDLPIQSPLEFTANPSGNYDYVWTTDNGVVIPKNTLKYAPIKQGRYTLNAVDKTFPSCSGVGTTYVIRPTDSLNADWDKDKFVNCAYTNLELCGATEATTFVWYKTNQLMPGVNTRCFKAFKDTATYKVVMQKFYTSTKFCKGDASAFVKSYEALTVGLNGSDTAFCFPYDEDARVSATPGYATYEWSPNSDLKTNSFIPKIGGKYKVKVTNSDNCFANDSIIITLVPQIKLALDTGDVAACWYAGYTIRPGEGFGKYEWKGTDIPIATNISTYQPSKSGIYKIKVTTTRGGCQDSGSVKIDFINPFNINIGSDVVVCDNTDTTFRFDPNSVFDSYAWFYNDTVSAPILFGKQKMSYTPPIPIIPAGLESAQFFVIGRAEIRTCYAYDRVKVTYFRDKIQQPDANNTVCIGTTVKFTPGPGFDSYIWKRDTLLLNSLDSELNKKDSSWSTNLVGRYSVDLSSKCGLKSSYYVLDNFKEIDLDLGNERTFCVGEDYYILNTLDTSVNKSYSYTWRDLTNSNKIITANQKDSKYDIRDVVYVSLTAIDTNNCIKIDSVAIGVNEDCFLIPNLITPIDKDKSLVKANDTFAIRGMYPGEWSIEIYNRWGDRVYKNEQYNNEWGGDNVTNGIYFYSLKSKKKSKEYKGWVQVVSN